VDERVFLQVFLVVALPLMGLVYALLGSLKLSLAERLRLDEGKVGRLVAGFGMMVGPTIMACGFLTDALGRKGVFLGGMALIALAVFLLARGRTYAAATAAVLLLGAGWSGAVNVGNVLMRVSVVDPDRLTRWMNFYDCIFGFGAFAAPFILGLLLKRAGFGKGLSVLGAVMLVPLTLGALARMNPDTAAAVSTASAGLSSLFTSKLFWLAGLAFLFYVPIESSVAGWATTLVAKQGPGGERAASIALSGFWLAFMGSRLLVSIVGVHKKELYFLLGLSLACVALMLALVGFRGRTPVAAVVALCGLICGPVFPTLIGVYLSGVDAHLLGRAVGFFFAFASVGWTLVPAGIGALARKSGDIQRGFRVAVASAVLFAVFAGLLAL
jgi:fucose permease